MQALAVATEAALKLPPPSALPVSPVDGQVARVKVSANGPVWTFVYLAGSTAPRWHFVGGAPLWSIVPTDANGNTISSADIPGSVGPDINVPFAGVYDADWGFRGSKMSNGALGQMAPFQGAASPFPTVAGLTNTAAAAIDTTVSASGQGTLVAGTVMRAKYNASGSVWFMQRWMRLRPVALT
jgi:hypothetical protein